MSSTQHMLSRLGTIVVLLALVLTMTFSSTRLTSAQDERAGEAKPDGPGLATSISTFVNPDPNALAAALVGSGVTITSATYSGAGTAAGTFSGAGVPIGIESGIILSSGFIGNVVGPNVSDSITAAHGLAGDADLDALVGGGTTDAAVLNLSFEADAQTVSFNYVFSSDEYNEYVNSSFNDVFAFFVNGVNCANAGGGPVSINNVNLGSNAGLYRNNDLQDGGGSIDTEMDGLTVVLTCTATVNAAPAVNTLKLAIADRGDFAFDSNVFIQGQSLTTNVPPVANNDTATASCATATTINVLANDTDSDGPAVLSIASVSSPSTSGGTVTTDGATVTYTGAAGFSGTDTFTYTVTDGQSSSTATVTVEVAPCNLPPTVDVADATGDCSGATINVTITDPDAGDTHTAVVDWGDGNVEDLGSVPAAFSASHAYGAAGVYAVSVTVTDAAGESASDGASVTVNYTIVDNGFQPPLRNDGSRVFKYKSTIPVKVVVLDCDGSVAEGLTIEIKLAKVSGSTPGPDITPLESTSAADTTGFMRFAGDHYIYNLATKPLEDPTATYRLRVVIQETGQIVGPIDFGLKN